MTSLVLVGELNPYGSDPGFALFHLPRRASGDRLREHLGLRDVTYEALAKVNLCDRAWSNQAAFEEAINLRFKYRVMVCLGVKVRRAFGAPPPFTSAEDFFGCRLVSLPHPSGLCRVWNEPGARDRARALLREVAPDVPWGEV